MLASAGSAQAVEAEVQGGADAIEKVFGISPKWFRCATGQYSASSIKQIKSLNFAVAGYSVLGDGGASFSAAQAARVVGSAKGGDVIVAHINQPHKPAGLGVIEGMLRLKAEGFKFLWLKDGF